jgi:hypothetical protein
MDGEWRPKDYFTFEDMMKEEESTAWDRRFVK